jgi:hypothetical protein
MCVIRQSVSCDRFEETHLCSFHSSFVNVKHSNPYKSIIMAVHNHQWHYSPESGLGLPYWFHDDITMWVISSTIDLVVVNLIRPPETSSGEATIDI